MDLHFVFTEALKGARRHLSMMVAVVVCVAVSLTLVGAAWLLARQVDALKGYWYNKVEVSVFLCGTASDTAVCPNGRVTAPQRAAVLAALKRLPVTEHVYHESPQQAWNRFKEAYRGSRVLAQVTASSMPETFRVKLTDPTQFKRVADVVAPMAGVESVQDQRKLLAPFFSVVGALQTASLLVAAAQVLIALLLIANTVRTAVAARKREVSVMRLVGASKMMIRGPFLGEALLAGLAGSVLAVASLTAVQQFVATRGFVSKIGPVPYVTWVDVATIAPALVAGGLLLPMAAAAFTLRKHLRV